MKFTYRNVIETLKKSEKKLKINTSGSVAGNKKEKIRSGQSYLYKQRGMESEVIEVKFKKNVWGSSLNQALSETLKRFPYFNTKLLELDGDFYIVSNESSMIAKKTDKLYKLGSIAINYHLLDVTYYDKSVYISFHHALCDGRGIKPFVETLIYYYCKFQYNSNKKIDGIRLADEPLLEGETLDPFMQEYEYDKTKEKDFISLGRDAFALDENKMNDDITDYRYEVEIPLKEFIEVCKKNNATPVILVSLLMSKAITKIYPEYDKPINANIATDMREQLGVPNTFKNCVKSMILPYSKDFSKKSLKEQATEYREILNKQRDVDYCKREANSMLGLFNKLDELNSYEEKQKIMSFFEGMLLNTYVISYLGKFNIGDNNKYIDSIHLYNSGTIGLGINMISTDEKMTIDFKQNFSSSRYVKAFTNELDALGIPNNRSRCIEFTTPEDKLLKRK